MFFKTDDQKLCDILKKTPTLESLFNKIGLSSLLKKNSNTGVFCEYWKIFKNSFCYRTAVGAFDLALLYT